MAFGNTHIMSRGKAVESRGCLCGVHAITRQETKTMSVKLRTFTYIQRSPRSGSELYYVRLSGSLRSRVASINNVYYLIIIFEGIPVIP